MHLYPVDWITVTRYCMASPSVRPELRRATYDAAITSRRPYDVSTGYPCDSEYCSKSLSLFSLPMSINGMASSYLADDCQLVSDVRPRRLRSSDSGFCAVRHTRTTYGDRCFAVAGPRVWNSLPTERRQSDRLGQFKRRLKTHFFGLWDHSAL